MNCISSVALGSDLDKRKILLHAMDLSPADTSIVTAALGGCDVQFVSSAPRPALASVECDYFIQLSEEDRPLFKYLGEIVSFLEGDPYWGAVSAMSWQGGFNGVAAGPEARTEWDRMGARLYERSAFADSPFLVLKAQVLKWIEASEGGLVPEPAVRMRLLAAASRIGFSQFVFQKGFTDRAPWCPDFESQRQQVEALTSHFPEYGRLFRLHQNSFGVRAKKLFEVWCADRREGRFSLCLDLSNLTATHNGTTKVMVETVRSFARSSSHLFRLRVLASQPAFQFHFTEGAPAGIEFVPLEGPRDQAASSFALRIGQPWFFGDIERLDSIGFYRGDFFLDTIAWDCSYIGGPHIEQIWKLIGEVSDFMFFNSQFTSERFNRRFPRVGASWVIYHSMKPSEYLVGSRPTSKARDIILVVGNQLDHKLLAPTLDWLSHAFPLETFMAIGSLGKAQRHNVVGVVSGGLSVEEMQDLYANAKMVVYPSNYEGFGFPIFEALAVGSPVLVQDHQLSRELKDRSGFEKIVLYQSFEELGIRINELLAMGQAHDFASEKSHLPSWDWATDEIQTNLQHAFVNRMQPRAKPELSLLPFIPPGQIDHYDNNVIAFRSKVFFKLAHRFENLIFRFRLLREGARWLVIGARSLRGLLRKAMNHNLAKRDIVR